MCGGMPRKARAMKIKMRLRLGKAAQKSKRRVAAVEFACSDYCAAEVSIDA